MTNAPTNHASAEATYPKDKIPAIRRLMMPRDTNALGTIFGGVILSEIDLAAAIEAWVLEPFDENSP